MLRRSLRALAGLPCAIVCLGCLFLLALLGTIHQAEHGLLAARDRYFDSWFVLLGGWVPFPGTQTVCALFTLNLLVSLAAMLALRVARMGLILIHGGLALLLATAAWTHWTAQSGVIILNEGETATEARVPSHQVPPPDLPPVGNAETQSATHWQSEKPVQQPEPAVQLDPASFDLPIALTLMETTKETHPHSAMPRAFRSRVRVRSADGFEHEALIEMNRPLHIGDTTIYQSGFAANSSLGANQSTFAVVRNPVRSVPAIAAGITILGLALHFGQALFADLRRTSAARRPRKPKRHKQPTEPSPTVLPEPACARSS